jgi:hypothetical protein
MYLHPCLPFVRASFISPLDVTCSGTPVIDGTGSNGRLLEKERWRRMRTSQASGQTEDWEHLLFKFECLFSVRWRWSKDNDTQSVSVILSDGWVSAGSLFPSIYRYPLLVHLKCKHEAVVHLSRLLLTPLTNSGQWSLLASGKEHVDRDFKRVRPTFYLLLCWTQTPCVLEVSSFPSSRIRMLYHGWSL